jgi:hypothetical protein
MLEETDNTQEYSLSYDALVTGFIIKPLVDNVNALEPLVITHGEMILDIAKNMEFSDKSRALTTIVYVIAQILNIEKLEAESSLFLSMQNINNVDKKNLEALLKTDFSLFKGDDVFIELLVFFNGLANIAGVKDLQEALLEFYDFSSTV